MSTKKSAARHKNANWHRVRVALYERNGNYVLVRAQINDSGRTPCGEVGFVEEIHLGLVAHVNEAVVSCLSCGDQPFGTCPECGEWGQP